MYMGITPYVVENNYSSTIEVKAVFETKPRSLRITYGDLAPKGRIEETDIYLKDTRINRIILLENAAQKPPQMIFMSRYSDEQLEKKENPVTFTLTPEFAIIASEKPSLPKAAPSIRVSKKEEGDCQAQLKNCQSALAEAQRAVK